MSTELPLERLFRDKTKAEKAVFPQMNVDYSLQYFNLVAYLKANVYGLIDAGLAANSDTPGLYTAHNSEHFDEVVRYAGELLGVRNGDESIDLSAYELYLLLVAIRIHDAGNIHGREDHEKKCFSVLRNCGEAAGNDASEKRVIGQIAQAHGGRTPCEQKDTIGITLQEFRPMGSRKIRPQLLAAIVRFADEICESRNRAPGYLLKFGTLPEHNEIYHKYAESIIASVVEEQGNTLTLCFQIKVQDLAREWGFSKNSEGAIKKQYLLDFVIERLEKMDRERRYCNRFSKQLYTVDRIRASIEIIDDEHEPLELIKVPELCDSGYPEESCEVLKDGLKMYCNPTYWADKYSLEVSNGSENV
jgi:hypothetical protein